MVTPGPLQKQFLSTLSLRRATYGALKHVHQTEISIHALLAESDLLYAMGYYRCRNFYPRSPCGERRVFERVDKIL